MIRLFNFILAMVASLALVGVYGLKYGVEDTAAHKSSLIRAVAQKKADLSLLQADWASLNQPGHIEPIIQRHAETLGLQVVDPKQFVNFDDLPMRPAKPDVAALDELFLAIEAGYDPIAALIEEQL